jgi:hypothetical protein
MMAFTMKRFLQHSQAVSLNTDFDDVRILTSEQLFAKGKQPKSKAKKSPVTVEHCLSPFVYHLNCIEVIEQQRMLLCNHLNQITYEPTVTTEKQQFNVCQTTAISGKMHKHFLTKYNKSWCRKKPVLNSTLYMMKSKLLCLVKFGLVVKYMFHHVDKNSRNFSSIR